MLAETMVRADAYCNWIETELSSSRSYKDISTHIIHLASHNEILRTGFSAFSTSSSGSFSQVVWKQLDSVQIMEVTKFTRKFTIGSDESMLHPLTIQVNTSYAKPRILFQLHHALYDGWSFDLLLSDLHDLLSGKNPDPRPQYSEIVKYYSSGLREDELAESTAYWKQLLHGYSPATLPNFNGKIVPGNTLCSVSRKSSVGICSLFGRATELSIDRKSTRLNSSHWE